MVKIDIMADRISEFDNRNFNTKRDIETTNYVLFKLADVLKNMNSDAVCIDCGAHKGLVSEVLLRFGGKVYAYEPNIYLYNYLRFRLFEYVQNGSLSVSNLAVWNKEAEVKLFMAADYTAENFLNNLSEGCSIKKEKNNAVILPTSAENSQIVKTIDLTKFISGFDQEIYLLKLDIEGAEFDVLKSLIESNTYKRVKHIYVECHDHKIPELKGIADNVRKLIADNNINNIHLDWM